MSYIIFYYLSNAWEFKEKITNYLTGYESKFYELYSELYS